MLVRALLLIPFFLLTARTLHADDVAVGVSGGSLKLSSTGAMIDVTIDQTGLPSTKFRVTPAVGTTVNGSSTASVFNNVTSDLRIQQTAGGGSYMIEDSVIARDLRVNGSAPDGLVVGFIGSMKVKRDISFKATAGSSVLSTAPGSVKRNIKFKCGGVGNSTTVLNSTVVGGDVRIDSADGTDVVVLAPNTKVKGDFRVNFGEGINTFVDTSSNEYRGDLKITGGDGTNTAVVTGQLDRDLSVLFGHGDGNTVVLTAEIGGSVRATSGGELSTLTVAPSTTTPWKSLRFDGGDGGDTVNFGPNTTFDRDVDLRLGAGDNTISGGAFARTRSLKVTAGPGLDSIEFDATHVDKNCSIDLGSSPSATPDVLQLIGTRVDGALSILSDLNRCNVTLTSLTVGGDARLDLGRGANTVGIDSGTFKSLTCLGTNEIDKYTLTGTVTTAKNTSFLLGNGNNNIAIATIDCGGDFIVRTGNGNDTISITTPNISGATDIDLGSGMNSGP